MGFLSHLQGHCPVGVPRWSWVAVQLGLFFLALGHPLSDIFGLRQGRSLEAERAIEAAVVWVERQTAQQ